MAWGSFVDRYEGLIERWCQRWGLQECDRKDVTQDVLLSLHASLRDFQYDPSRSFRAWLKTVTRNAAAKSIKLAQKPGRGDGGTEVVRLMQSVKARQDLTDRLAEEYDLELTELAQLRVRLSVKPRTWQAYWMTAMEGRTGAETAQTLGMKVCHVYVAKSEVLRALRTEIERLEPNSDVQISLESRAEVGLPD